MAPETLCDLCQASRLDPHPAALPDTPAAPTRLEPADLATPNMTRMVAKTAVPMVPVRRLVLALRIFELQIIERRNRLAFDEMRGKRCGGHYCFGAAGARNRKRTQNEETTIHSEILSGA